MDWKDVTRLEVGRVGQNLFDGEICCEPAFSIHEYTGFPEGGYQYLPWIQDELDDFESAPNFYGWIYTVYARKADGEVEAVADFATEDAREAKLFAQSLAKRLGIPCIGPS